MPREIAWHRAAWPRGTPSPPASPSNAFISCPGISQARRSAIWARKRSARGTITSLPLLERPQGKTTNFVDVGGLEIPTVVQGIAWIDQESFPDQPHADRSCRVSSSLSDAAGFAQPQGTCSADDGGHIRGNSTSGCCDPPMAAQRSDSASCV